MTQQEHNARIKGLIDDETPATCCNCWVGFEPVNPDIVDRYSYCQHWDTTKPNEYHCDYWAHIALSYNSTAPYWIDPITRQRRSDEEIMANCSPKAVAARLRAQESNGTFKRKAQEHIKRKALWEKVVYENMDEETAKEYFYTTRDAKR